MKISKIAPIGAIVATMAVHNGLAQPNTDLFPVTLQVTCASTNQNGLVFKRLVASDLISDCVPGTDQANGSIFSLVFNRSNNSLDVVSGTNQVLVCTALSFAGGLALTNSNNTTVVFQSFVFVGTNTVASGSFEATERLVSATSNQPAVFALSGTLNYTEPASGTNGPTICHGTLVVGSALTRVGDINDPGNDNDGTQNPGNHLGTDGGMPGLSGVLGGRLGRP